MPSLAAPLGTGSLSAGPVGAAAPSAGGAPTEQVVVVAAFTAVVYAVILWVMVRERSGHTTLVGRAADTVARRDGGPRWFALPLHVSVAGALSGAVGLYWDVSYHIARGRDEGPLANPAHYFIFIGLIAIFAGGALALALAKDRLPRRTLRITGSWHVPIGPAIGTAVALFALLGFPLDDVWHRLFGQDVTEWGPTHVLMIGGTLMLPYTMLLTCAEARQLGPSRLRSRFEWTAIVILAAGPVAFLLEFAYGVPQFPLVNDPVVLTVATVGTFTLAMYRGLRWVASIWVAQAALQVALVALNVWAFDALTPWPPLLLGGALVAAALARRARPTMPYGAGAGVAMAMGMLLVEYFWTQATRPMPWPLAMMPWAVLFAGVTGAGIGMVATWMHQRLAAVADSEPATSRSAREVRTGRWALAAALAVLAVFVVNVPPHGPEGGTADVRVGPQHHGRAYLTVRTDPDLVRHAYWFEVLSWQGGGFVHADLEPAGEGVWRTDVPVPVTGSWKTLVRLHTPLHELAAAPVYLPADPAIPAEEYAPVSGSRPFVEEKVIMRREEKQGVPGWLWGAAYVVVGGLFLGLFTTVAAGYSAAGRGGFGSGGTSAPSARAPRIVRRLARAGA
jgi:MFS family permease